MSLLVPPVLLGQRIIGDVSFYYCNRSAVFVIDNDIDISDQKITIIAKSILVHEQTTVRAKEIEFETTEGVVCSGTLCYQVFTNYGEAPDVASETPYSADTMCSTTWISREHAKEAWQTRYLNLR